jgi:hypothetical protein
VLTLHDYSDVLYVVQYAHLYRFKTAGSNQDRTMPERAARTIAAGDVIGVEGGTNYVSGAFVERPTPGDYFVHLHLTIRKFTGANAVAEVDRAQGPLWRYLSRLTNFMCANSDYETTGYCRAPRRIRTMVDPETLLAPALPAAMVVLPPGPVPPYNSNDANHVRNPHVDDVKLRYVPTAIAQPAVVNPPGPGPISLPTLAYFYIAVGRPEFYSSAAPEAEIRRRPGVAGTADGVQGYFAESVDCRTSWSASRWNPATREGKLTYGAYTPVYPR